MNGTRGADSDNTLDTYPAMYFETDLMHCVVSSCDQEKMWWLCSP